MDQTTDEYRGKLAAAAKDVEPAKATLDAARKANDAYNEQAAATGTYDFDHGRALMAEIRKGTERLFAAQRAATLLRAHDHERSPDYPPRQRSGHVLPS